MGIIGWILLGFLAGVIAKAIMPGEERVGLFVTLLVGVAGALLGGSWRRLSGSATRSTSSSTSVHGSPPSWAR